MDDKRYRREMAGGLVIAACLVSSFATMLLASKHTAQIVFYASWLVATNTFFLVTALAGSLKTKRGHVIASRAHTPVRFWTFFCMGYALFNWIGAWGLVTVLSSMK